MMAAMQAAMTATATTAAAITATNTAPVIALSGLALRAGARELVRGLELHVQAGERWVVLGPNGAGKSSLLFALAGVRCADAGDIALAGRPLAHWSIEALAAERAYVGDRWLDPFAASVLETVLTARYRFGAGGATASAEDLRRAQDELAQLDCAPLATHDVRTLSRGERQRVALATALAQDTPLVLLDEPTSHQDPRHQALVLDRLARLPGRTLVASMHDVNAAARFATHVLLLSGQGHWQGGPAAEALTAPALSALFDARFEAVAGSHGQLFHLADGVAAGRQGS
jgi:iron complex transport system ATP-binding protein